MFEVFADRAKGVRLEDFPEGKREEIWRLYQWIATYDEDISLAAKKAVRNIRNTALLKYFLGIYPDIAVITYQPHEYVAMMSYALYAKERGEEFDLKYVRSAVAMSIGAIEAIDELYRIARHIAMNLGEYREFADHLIELNLVTDIEQDLIDFLSWLGHPPASDAYRQTKDLSWRAVHKAIHREALLAQRELARLLYNQRYTRSQPAVREPVPSAP